MKRRRTSITELKNSNSSSHSSKSTFWRLWEYLKPDRAYAGGALLALIVSSACNQALPGIIGSALDESSSSSGEGDTLVEETADGNSKNNKEDGTSPFKGFSMISSITKKMSNSTLFGLAAAVFATATISSWIRIYLLRISTERTSKRMRDDTFENAILLDKAYYDEINSADVVSVLGVDVQKASEAFSEVSAQGLRGLSSVIFGCFHMVSISGKLTLVSLAVVPFVGVSTVLLAGEARKRNEEVRRIQDYCSSFASERLSGISTIKNFSQEKNEADKYKLLTEKACNAARAAAVMEGRFRGILTFSLNTSLFVVMYFGGSLVSKRELTIGKLTSFAMYSLLVGLGCASISTCYAELAKSLVSAKRVFTLMDGKSNMPVGVGDKEVRLSEKDSIIEFRKVKFSYPARKSVTVLKSISFKVNEGEVVCFVGKSGAGKSTIANLLTRLYDCDEGSVQYCGKDVRDLEVQWFRNQIAVVDQEPVLFERSLDENIRYGKANASNEEVKRAMDEANASEFIQLLPEQGETLVGERGGQVSSGQKQRIAISRAILKDPPVLVLDEATSFLDQQSKTLMREAIERLISKRKTILIIAHHKWPLQYANKLVVLNEGRIIYEGTQEELEANASSSMEWLIAASIIQEMD